MDYEQFVINKLIRGEILRVPEDWKEFINRIAEQAANQCDNCLGICYGYDTISLILGKNNEDN